MRNLLPRIFNKKKETTEKSPFCHIFYSIFITYLVSTKIYILFKELFIFHLTYFNVSIDFHFQFFCPIRLCMVAHHCQSKQIKINENKEIEKIKIILFRKNPQNYHGLWVPNLMKKFLKRHKTTMAHERQTWYLVIRLNI